MNAIYISWCWLYLTTKLPTWDHTQFSGAKIAPAMCRFRLKSAWIFHRLSPFEHKHTSSQCRADPKLNEKNRHRKTRKSPVCNTIIFCFDFSQQKNQYRSPCYTRTTNIFTATDFQSENTACNKIIIKVRKMYGSTKSRHQRTDSKCQATSMLAFAKKNDEQYCLTVKYSRTFLHFFFLHWTFSICNVMFMRCWFAA